MLNQVILIGRLTSDPIIKVLEDGKKVSDIRLAVQRSFKNVDGTYETDFITVTLWQGLAESLNKYCTKGTLVAVKARLQTRHITSQVIYQVVKKKPPCRKKIPIFRCLFLYVLRLLKIGNIDIIDQGVDNNEN